MQNNPLHMGNEHLDSTEGVLLHGDVAKTTYIIGYIVATLGIAWAAELFGFRGGAVAQVVLLIAFFPVIVAFAFNVAQRRPARAQMTPLIHRITSRSVVFAVAYPLLFIAAAAVIVLVTGAGHISAGGLSNKLSVNSLILFLILVVVTFFLSFGEEYGWRGYLLPALTLKQGKVVATTVVGVVWAFFHIPIYYQLAAIAGVSPPALTVLNAGFVVTFAFAFSFCYYLTESILPCMLLHGIWDVTLPTVFGQGGSGIIEIDGLHLSVLLLSMGAVLVPWFITRFYKMNAAIPEVGAAPRRL